MGAEIAAADYGRVRLTAGTLPGYTEEPCIAVTLTNPDGQYPDGRTVPRADFLAAVAAECDVIVIDRADLPEVSGADGVYSVGRRTMMHRTTVAEAREWAIHWLALAEHLDAHPPVDEADVEALAQEITAVAQEYPGDQPGALAARGLARRLLATGRIEVKR